jgi:hypothetical protein
MLLGAAVGRSAISKQAPVTLIAKCALMGRKRSAELANRIPSPLGRLTPTPWTSARPERDGWRRLVEAAFPGVERYRVDAESAAKLGDGQAAISLTLDLAAPPFAPRVATCRRPESDHECSPGEETWASGIDATLGAKDGSAKRLPAERIMSHAPAE